MKWRGVLTFGGLLATLALLPAGARAAEPSLGEIWTSEVGAASVTFYGEIDPGGEATTYRFEYATDQAFEEKGFTGAAKAPAGGSASAGSGSVLVTVSQHVSALRVGTLYHYRLTATNGSGTAESATRTFTTQGAGGAFALPDARGWELVSPAEKNGGAVEGPEQVHGGGVIEAAAGGAGEVTYSSTSSFGGYEALGAPPASQYISRRAAGGWLTANITAPALSGSFGAEPNGVPYQLFSPDLARGVLLNGLRCRGEGSDCPVANPPLPGSGAPAGYQDYYLRNDEDGTYSAVVTESNAQVGLEPSEFTLAFAGASPDLRHLVLSTCAALTPGATEVPAAEGCDQAKPNLYEYSEGQLSLVNVAPGASLPAQSSSVSADGSRVYFDEGGKLCLREGDSVQQVDQAQGGGGAFQTATADGSIAFFTAAGNLYRYDASARSSQQIATGVKGVLGASENGQAVYFQDASALEEWDEGTTRTVAAGAEAALAGDYPPTTGTARVSADGNRLLFLSKASLTGYDNTDAHTRQLDSEVFLWNAAGAGLLCLSCNPTGERPIGPSTISGAYSNGSAAAAGPGQIVTDSYKPRNLSATADRVFFDSADALVALDTNKASDAYQWEGQGSGSCTQPGGCLSLISSGTDPDGAAFLDASESGDDVYFLTSSSLASGDPGSRDVYDARVGGGFPVGVPPIPCEGDACAPLPSPPEDPTVGTLVPGPGNPPVHFPPVKKCPKGKRRIVKGGTVRCVAKHRRRHGKGKKK
ncbi:MAG: hypothetical protein ACTHNP_07095 [Solirubrobacterales bacterium]